MRGEISIGERFAAEQCIPCRTGFSREEASVYTMSSALRRLTSSRLKPVLQGSWLNRTLTLDDRGPLLRGHAVNPHALSVILAVDEPAETEFFDHIDRREISRLDDGDQR